MIKYIVILSAVLLISSCASHGAYQDTVQSWVGHPESDLVRSNGTPSDSYTSGNSKFLTYTDKSNRTDLTLICKTTFEIVQGKVVGVTSVGNNCIM